jgi:hypothetical protein
MTRNRARTDARNCDSPVPRALFRRNRDRETQKNLETHRCVAGRVYDGGHPCESGTRILHVFAETAAGFTFLFRQQTTTAPFFFLHFFHCASEFYFIFLSTLFAFRVSNTTSYPVHRLWYHRSCMVDLIIDALSQLLLTVYMRTVYEFGTRIRF